MSWLCPTDSCLIGGWEAAFESKYPSLTELIMFIRKGEEKGTRRSGYLLGFNQIEE